MNMYKKDDEGDEMGEEHMEGHEEGKGCKGGGWDEWKMKKCGCPACRMMLAMKKMSMMRGMMPGMMSGMGMMPGMMHMGMGMGPGMGMGMGGGMGMEKPSWRKFMSSDEKIAKLEAYLKDLQAEQKAVEEKIAFIRSKAQP